MGEAQVGRRIKDPLEEEGDVGGRDGPAALAVQGDLEVRHVRVELHQRAWGQVQRVRQRHRVLIARLHVVAPRVAGGLQAGAVLVDDTEPQAHDVGQLAADAVDPRVRTRQLVLVVGAAEHGAQHQGDGVVLVLGVELVFDTGPVVVDGDAALPGVQVHGKGRHLLGVLQPLVGGVGQDLVKNLEKPRHEVHPLQAKARGRARQRLPRLLLWERGDPFL